MHTRAKPRNLTDIYDKLTDDDRWFMVQALKLRYPDQHWDLATLPFVGWQIALSAMSRAHEPGSYTLYDKMNYYEANGEWIDLPMATIAEYYSKFTQDELRMIQFAYNRCKGLVDFPAVPFVSLNDAEMSLWILMSELNQTRPAQRRFRQLRNKVSNYKTASFHKAMFGLDTDPVLIVEQIVEHFGT